MLIGYGTSAVAGAAAGRSPPSSDAAHDLAVDAGPPAAEPAAGQPRPRRRPRGACISPLVRRLARDRGIDLATLAGSDPAGVIRRCDVEACSIAAAPARALGADVADRRVARPSGCR